MVNCGIKLVKGSIGSLLSSTGDWLPVAPLLLKVKVHGLVLTTYCSTWKPNRQLVITNLETKVYT